LIPAVVRGQAATVGNRLRANTNMRHRLRFGLLFLLGLASNGADDRRALPVVIADAGPIQNLKRRVAIPINGQLERHMLVFVFTDEPSSAIDSSWLEAFQSFIVEQVKRRAASRNTKRPKTIAKPTRRRREGRKTRHAKSSTPTNRNFMAGEFSGPARIRVGRLFFVLR
jgi:hypothetical protein